jgi:phage/plasmid-like protein (TIGR03299 family)
MAHLIQNNEIAYVGTKPWHGLGFEVEPGTSGERMLTVAGINYEIRLDPVVVNGITLPNYRAIVRGDNGTVFSIQSDRYHPVQNLDIVNLFQEYCAAGHATMETVGAIRGGAIVWALAKLNGRTTANIHGSDPVSGYILFSTSNDGTLPTRGFPTQVRVVCSNTFRAAGGYRKGKRAPSGFTMKHSTKWTSDRADEAKEVLGIAIEDIQEFNELSETLSNVKIDRKGQIEFISQLLDGKCILDQTIEATNQSQQVASGFDSDASLLDAIMGTSPSVSLAPIAVQNGEDKLNRVGKAILESILTSPGSDLDSAHNTLWGAINGVSYYTDHIASRSQDSRLYNSWFGTNQTLKESAVDVAKQMAGIN